MHGAILLCQSELDEQMRLDRLRACGHMSRIVLCALLEREREGMILKGRGKFKNHCFVRRKSGRCVFHEILSLSSLLRTSINPLREMKFEKWLDNGASLSVHRPSGFRNMTPGTPNALLGGPRTAATLPRKDAQN